MGSKLSFILSLLFVSVLFVLMGDIIAIQFIYTNLDAVSVSAGYLISRDGSITSEVRYLVDREAGAFIEPTNYSPPIYGELYEYVVFKPYKPLFISNDTITVRVTRSVVIGYYK